MREIKFRAKELNTGKWVIGDLRILCTRPHIHNFLYSPSKKYIDMSTIGQFTGLHDKSGKEIYEGDIIRFVWTDYVGKGKNKVPVLKYVENCPPKVISYRTGAFGYVNFEADEYLEEEWLTILDDPCEVIGNIHDNPELLKGK